MKRKKPNCAICSWARGGIWFPECEAQGYAHTLFVHDNRKCRKLFKLKEKT